MSLTSLRRSYDNVLLSNASTLATVESTLRNLTWFLPGRFEDAELASEGLYSALNLLSLYHDNLLSRIYKQHRLHSSPSAFPKLPASPSLRDTGNSTTPGLKVSLPSTPLPPPSPHHQYTSHLFSTSPLYRWAANRLVILGYIQLVLEMLVRKRRGDGRRWGVVAGIEGLKTTLRLILLGITRRPLPSHPLPQREFDPSLLSPSSQSSLPDTIDPSARYPIIPTLPTSSLATSYILPKTMELSKRYQPSPLTILPELSTTSEWLGEIIHSSSGLISVMSLIYFARKQKRRLRLGSDGGIGNSIGVDWDLLSISDSVSATSIPLILNFLARYLRKSSEKGEHTPLLTSTYAERDFNLLYTFLRGSLYTRWTRPKVERWLDWMGEKPVLGLVAGLVGDHVRLVDEYFYYTTA